MRKFFQLDRSCRYRAKVLYDLSIIAKRTQIDRRSWWAMASCDVEEESDSPQYQPTIERIQFRSIGVPTFEIGSYAETRRILFCKIS
jgi:hypothetical protein